MGESHNGNGHGETLPAPQGNAGRFQKGDPRINRSGTIAPFTKLQALAQDILLDKDPESQKTRTETLILQWYESGNWKAQKAALEFAFGKPRETLDVRIQTMALLQVIVPMLAPFIDQTKKTELARTLTAIERRDSEDN